MRGCNPTCAACSPTYLPRISQGDLLLEDTDGNPVLSGTPLAPCLITCTFSAAEAEAQPDQPQRQAPTTLPPLPLQSSSSPAPTLTPTPTSTPDP